MSRSNHLKDKNGKSNMFSVDKCDDESAARTRPISFEEIMLRRRNKELLGNVKDPAREARTISPGGSTEKIADHSDSERIFKHDKSSFSREKHGLEELVNVSSKKRLGSICVKKDDVTIGKDRENYISETKSSAGLNNLGRVTKEKSGKEISGLRKNEWISENSEYEARIRQSRDSINKDRHADINRPKSERNTKKKNHIGDDENFNKYHTERKHGKDRHDRGKMKKRSNNDSEVIAEKRHHRDSDDKDRHTEGKGKFDREVKRKYRNGDDETQDRNATRKQDLGKHHSQQIQERKERRESVKSHHGESTAKRRRSRSREREDRRRRTPSFSPSAPKHTYHDGERKELSMLSHKDSSRKKHSDVDRSRVSTNGSSSHHHRHGGSTSGLGGYSPRKRKSEAAVKTPSPSKHSPEKKKRAGWDLPPVGKDNPSPAIVSSSFQLSNHTTLSNMQNLAAAATSVDPAIVKLLPMSFLSDVSTGKNANIDSVQLTQATRPMRRLYLENIPASVSEKAVMDCFNNLLFSAGANHIQQVQPCISCILHKDRGQALVEFLTAEDASAALSFDGSTLFGSIVKIRRPKDYIEVSTGELERSVDAAVTISDVVIDSADKIFVGGISNHVSSEMLMEIAGAFGSLKAYHFETVENNGSCAFLEYVDNTVTIKACAGLNGMRLGGEVLTVVQAMPDALTQNNGGKPPSYGIPEHAKPLLRKPTQVLKIQNVFAVESISSLSDMGIEEVLEDVRLECARFGTIKSLNVVRDCSEKNLATKSEFEVMNKLDSEEASQDRLCNINDAEPSFSEKATSPKFKGTSGNELCNEKELEEDEVDDGSSVDINADVFDNKPCQEEQTTTDTTVEDTDNKSIPSSIIQEGPDYQDTPTNGPELHDEKAANSAGLDIEENIASGIVDSKDTVDSKDDVSLLQEGSSERDASAELGGPRKCIDEEDNIHDDVFEQGSVLVEYKRTEACCSAAHCLHGRLFDGRMVTVEYVSLSQYRARFEK